MASTKENIVKYIDLKGITQSKFCKKNSLSNGFLTNKGNVGSDKIHNILKNYPDIDPEWLITGKGEMLRRNVQNTSPPDQAQSKVQDTQKKQEILFEEQLDSYKDHIQTLKESVQTLKEQLTTKDQQLAVKDEQIAEKDELLKQLALRKFPTVINDVEASHAPKGAKKVPSETVQS